MHFLPNDVLLGRDDVRNRHFGSLLAWSDDEIAPRSGFQLHPHSDLEIVTYVRDGVLSHEDTLGNKGKILAGEVQAISAGSGIQHAEVNAEDAETRLFQIWLKPRTRGGEPRYSGLSVDQLSADVVTLASGDPRDEAALKINADARVIRVKLKAGELLSRALPVGTRVYLVPASGRLLLGERSIEPRDGVAIYDEPEFEVRADSDAELLLVELIGS